MEISTLTQFAVAFFSALVASLILTSLVQRLAVRLGFVDRPDGGRKAQANPVALGGGAAIFTSVLFAIGVTFAFAYSQGVLSITPRVTDALLALLGASTVIVAVGIIDDIYSLRGLYKLIGQILAASILIAAGLRIEGFQIMQQEIVLGRMAIPFTLFWLLGSINAINLIDGIDGLAASVGLVLCLTLAAIMGWMGNVEVTILMLALAGAQLGFLKYNFAPASIYLGDAGSMFIGLVIGTAAIFTQTKGATVVALAVPVAVWCIPILDSAAAIMRRKLTGRSLFAPDRGHFHHSLLTRGWTVQQAVLFIGLIAATTCLSAFLSFYYKNELIALVTIAAMALFLVNTKTFGHIELALLKHRLSSTARAFSPSDRADESGVHHSSIHLQGSRQWNVLWGALVESASAYHLSRLMLNIHIPSLHEAFYAKWYCKVQRKDNDNVWHISNPLVVDGRVVGNVDISGVANGASAFPQMAQVLEFLETIESDIERTMGQISDSQDQADSADPVAGVGSAMHDAGDTHALLDETAKLKLIKHT